MKCARQLIAHSDSGFRKEEKDGADLGKAVRGANYIRLGTNHDLQKSARRETPCHLIDWHTGMLKTVTRSTFTSEMQAAVSAADWLLVLGITLHEIACGPVAPREAMRLREEGGLAFEVVLEVDALSLVAALSAARVKAPSEKEFALTFIMAT